MAKLRRLTVNESKSIVSRKNDLAEDIEKLKQQIVEEVVEKFREELPLEINRIVRHNGVEEIRLGNEAVLWMYGYVVESEEDNAIKIIFNYKRALTTPEEEEAKDFWTQAPMGTFGT